MYQIYISYLLGILGILTPLGFAIYFQYKKKSMHYEISTIEEVISLDDNDNDIKILVRNKEIKNIQFAALRFKNTGFESILPTDFQKNITIEFPPKTQIVTVQTVSIKPKDIELHGTFKKCVEIHPCLLNRGDIFDVFVFLTGFEGTKSDVIIEGRVNGVSEIRPTRRSPKVYYLFSLLFLLLVILNLNFLNQYKINSFVTMRVSQISIFLLLFSFIVSVLSYQMIKLSRIKDIFDD